MKLEAGKTYVFKDDAARDEYLDCGRFGSLLAVHYNNGFSLDSVDDDGFGCVNDSFGDPVEVVHPKEIHLFKESKPFDISEYEFSDDEVERTEMDGGELLLIIEAGHNAIGLNEKDVKAIAKHFKLI